MAVDTLPPCFARIVVILSLALSIQHANASDPDALETATTESLIANLAEIASADCGFSGGVSGSDFPPVMGQEHNAVMLLSPPVERRRHPAVVELVARGPRALPDLLKHLDDKTPTKLSFEHDGGFGDMWHATEVRAPEGAVDEAAIIKNAGIEFEQRGMAVTSIRKHQITVGDVCFAIMGMITNRVYSAVRYQPTACIVVNSPTSSPVIAKAIRALWPDGQDHTEVLYQRLIADLVRGDTAAATRLLFYFRSRARDAVVSRVRNAVEGREQSEDDWIGAVAFCDDRKLRDLVRRAVLEDHTGSATERGAVSLHGLPLDTIVNHLLRWKDGRDWNHVRAGQACLSIALHSYPESSGQIIETFWNSHPGDNMARGAIPMFYDLKTPPVKVLASLLTNLSNGCGRYLQDGPLDAGATQRWVDYRVCDNVFEIIGRVLGDTKTKCIGSHKEMDHKVQGLITRLEQPPAAWPFSVAEIDSRQAAQTQPQLLRRGLIRQINSTSTVPEERWLLNLQSDQMTENDWQRAAEALLSPPDGSPEDATTLLANRHLNRPAHLDKLSPAQRTQVSEVLARRLNSIMSASRGKTYPNGSFATFCSLLACSPDTPGKSAALRRLLALEHSAFLANGWPSGDDVDAMITIMTGLLLANVEGAPVTYLALTKKATPKNLAGAMNLEHFFRLLADSSTQKQMLEAAAWCFERSNSPWHLSRVSYATADDLGSAKLLKVQPFRIALRKALSDQREEGTLSLEVGKPDYCRIKWNSGGSSGQGVDALTAGLKPGGSMKIRHCDSLLEGVANGVFNDVKETEFHIYWPEIKRDEAIQKWVQLLQQPHH